MPCLIAFKDERLFPCGDLGPRLRRPLRRLISARSGAVVVAVIGGCPLIGAGRRRFGAARPTAGLSPLMYEPIARNRTGGEDFPPLVSDRGRDSEGSIAPAGPGIRRSAAGSPSSRARIRVALREAVEAERAGFPSSFFIRVIRAIRGSIRVLRISASIDVQQVVGWPPRPDGFDHGSHGFHGSRGTLRDGAVPIAARSRAAGRNRRRARPDRPAQGDRARCRRAGGGHRGCVGSGFIRRRSHGRPVMASAIAPPASVAGRLGSRVAGELVASSAASDPDGSGRRDRPRSGPRRSRPADPTGRGEGPRAGPARAGPSAPESDPERPASPKFPDRDPQRAGQRSCPRAELLPLSKVRCCGMLDFRDAATRATRQRGSMAYDAEMLSGFRHEVTQWSGGTRGTRRSSVR